MFDAREVKKTCNGMLPVRTYERIYRDALDAPAGNIVEVGTAHGAATVCLALALQVRGGSDRVYTFEKILGGTREVFGGVDENVRIIRDNFARFGVADRIELIIGDVRDHADRVPADDALAALFLDADGRIERDFDLFFNQLQMGGLVFIDDVREVARLGLVGVKGTSAQFKVDQKHRISRLLLDIYRRHGLVTDGEFIGPDTWVGHKSADVLASVPTAEIIDAYRELVFADARVSVIPGRRLAKRLIKGVLPESLVDRIRDAREDQRVRQSGRNRRREPSGP